MKSLDRIIDEDIDTILKAKLPWEKLLGKKFLISGANGFLPAYLVLTILNLNKKFNKKCKIYALVRSERKSKKIFRKYLKNNSLKIIKSDISKKININDKIDYIIHAASYASPKYYRVDPVGTLLPNTIGTSNLLNFANQNKVKGFLFFSSSEVYGYVTAKKINEDTYGSLDPTDLRSCYAESKRMGENMCISWFKQYGVPVKIARVFHTYGPGMNLDDGRVFADFTAAIVKNNNIVLTSQGKAKRAFCYISDATIAFLLILLKGKNGQAYNVSNPNCYVTIQNLANTLRSLSLNKKTKVVIGKVPSKTNYMKSNVLYQNPDISKLLTLGWQPRILIKEGFSRTIKSFLEE